MDSFEQQASCDPAEVGSGLADSSNRRGNQGEEWNIVETGECNIFTDFNVQLPESFDHPDGRGVICGKQGIRAVT